MICAECPFKRESVHGWLGEASFKPEEFIAAHYHGGLRLPCHMAINWETKRNLETAPLCEGFLIFMKNDCKRPLNEEMVMAMKNVKVDRENVFSWRHEFVAHHRPKAPAAPRRKRTGRKAKS